MPQVTMNETRTCRGDAARRPPAIHCPREAQGLSLVTVAALGMVCTVWMLAASAAILPMYQRAAASRFTTVVRSAAEAGLDYATAELNAAVDAGIVSPIDDTTQNNEPKTSTVPPSIVGNSGAVVTVEVNNVAPPLWSLAYNELKDSLNPLSPYFLQPNRWRTIVSTAKYAGLTKKIVVVMAPISEAASAPTGTPPGNPVVPVPYFMHSMFGRASLSMSASSKTDGYDSRLGLYGGSNVLPTGGNVGASGPAALSGNAVVGGDLVVYSSPLGSLTLISATRSANAIIQDQLIVNGIGLGFKGTIGSTALPGDNVLGVDRAGQGLLYNPILAAQLNAQPVLPPAAAAPATAVNLGAVSLSGDQVLNVPPGDYIVNSLSVSGNAKIQMTPNSTGTFGKVRFFVEGASSGENVIQLTGNSIVNPSATPGNLQIWYNGSKRVILSGDSNFHGVVYAPNSEVNISGNGSYFGAITGREVSNSGNGYVHFDKALSDSGGTWGLTYVNQSGSILSGLGSALMFTGYRTISWQEI